MKKGKADPRRTQWIICAVLGIFAPYYVIIWAIVLLVKESKRATADKAMLYGGLGVITAASLMAVFMLLPYVRDGVPEGLAILLVVYGAAVVFGLFLVVSYFLLERRNRMIRQCAHLIMDEHITSVALIGEILGKDREQTISLLQKTIRIAPLDGASLSENGEEILFRKSLWAHLRVQCQRCGAILTVDLGQTLVCEYCGGALTAKRVTWE